MRDLLVVVPTRGRPANAIRLLEAVVSTSTEKTDVIFGLDDDDETKDTLRARIKLVGCSSGHQRDAMVEVGPRKGMAAWTNRLVMPRINDYRAFASLGDDHLPRTPGWDKILLDANGGTGISYGDDLIMGERLPTAPVISQNIIAALGWMCAPGLDHMCCDNIWKDVGMAAGCLFYCPEVIIEHLHWVAGKAIVDETYKEAGIFSLAHPDWRAYQEWRGTRMTHDIEVVRELTRGG